MNDWDMKQEKKKKVICDWLETLHNEMESAAQSTSFNPHGQDIANLYKHGGSLRQTVDCNILCQIIH